MAKQSVNIGATPNDRDADSIRTAFAKINENFTELYTALGINSDTTLNLGAFEFNGSTITTTDSTAITIDQATTVTSDLTVGGDIIPQTANGGDLGSAAKPWRSLYVSNNTIYIGSNSLKVDANGEILINNNRLVQDNGNYISLNLNVNDVNISDPQVGDTLQWAGGFWVNGSVGSSNPFDQDLDTTDSPNFVNLGLAGTAGAGYATLSVTIDRDFYIGLNDTSTGAKTFEFGRDGRLLVPGALYVDGNVYGGAGDRLYLAGDIGESVPAIEIPNSAQGTTTPLSINNSQGGGVEIVTGAGSWLFDDTRLLYFPTSSDDEYNIGESVDGFNIRSDGAFGISANFTTDAKYWLFDTDGGLTIPGDIKSEGAINIDINLSDSTKYTWRFGEDGVLNLPGALQNVRTNDRSITLGLNAGIGGVDTVAIGYIAGNISQGQESVAIGALAGTTQGARAVAVGPYAGSSNQAGASIAIGYNAGGDNQATLSVAVGDQAGTTNQGQQSTAVGSGAGNLDQGIGSVAIGSNAGAFYQGSRAVAVGVLAGSQNQGEYAVALGNFAGGSNQPANSIVINASGQALNGSAAGFFVDPIRNIDGSAFLNYNASTKEIGYSNDIRSENSINVDINLSDSTLRRWTFGEDGILNIPGGIKTSGFTIDLSTYRGVDDAGLGDYTITIDGNTIRSDRSSIGLLTPNSYGIVVDEDNKQVLIGGLDGEGTINLLFGSESITGENYDAQLQMTNVGVPETPSSFSITTQGDTNVWKFGGDGSLQIPGDIKSEGNINIDINLSDSTLRRWTFGEDGNTEFPGDITAGAVSATSLRTNENKIALGSLAGFENQNSSAIAIGGSAGVFDQGSSAVAIGSLTGYNSQGASAVAVGGLAGNVSQGAAAVAVGGAAGSVDQGVYAVAIGGVAGYTRQGANAIAIGQNAGHTDQPNNSIILNASGSILNGSEERALYVDPIRDIPGTSLLQYNSSTKEISHTNEIYSDQQISITVSGEDSTQKTWYFGNDGILNLPGSIQLSSGGIIKGTDGLQNGITIGEAENTTITLAGTTFFTKTARFYDGVHEAVYEMADATGVVEHDCTNGYIFYHTSPDANWTVNLTNFGLSTQEATTVTIVVVQGGTGYYPSALQISGVGQTINWQGNATPTPSTNRTDVVSFSIIRTGSGYTVLGQLTGF